MCIKKWSYLSLFILTVSYGCAIHPIYEGATTKPESGKIDYGVGIGYNQTKDVRGWPDSQEGTYTALERNGEIGGFAWLGLGNWFSLSATGLVGGGIQQKRNYEKNCWDKEEPFYSLQAYGGLKCILINTSYVGIAIKQEIGLPELFPTWFLLGFKNGKGKEIVTIGLNTYTVIAHPIRLCTAISLREDKKSRTTLFIGSTFPIWNVYGWPFSENNYYMFYIGTGYIWKSN